MIVICGCGFVLIITTTNIINIITIIIINISLLLSWLLFVAVVL